MTLRRKIIILLIRGNLFFDILISIRGHLQEIRAFPFFTVLFYLTNFILLLYEVISLVSVSGTVGQWGVIG